MFTKLLHYKGKLYSFCVYLFVFVWSIFPYADKDWGWHYKYEEYFITHGQILRNDIFSWTMPGYVWTNTSWLFDPILYILTKTIGFIGLSVTGAIINVLTFFILTVSFKLSFWKQLILLFSLSQ